MTRISAEQRLLRAMVADPGYLWARQCYAAFPGATGRLEESLVAIRHAQRLDPLSAFATGPNYTDSQIR
ncbi:MAG TPA: hypothetical protein VMM79_11120 [Longimicrobiales bacterium]|nr:hypothetical protein [Longimicrobiales bacterium]